MYIHERFCLNRVVLVCLCWQSDIYSEYNLISFNSLENCALLLAARNKGSQEAY